MDGHGIECSTQRAKQEHEHVVCRVKDRMFCGWGNGRRGWRSGLWSFHVIVFSHKITR